MSNFSFCYFMVSKVSSLLNHDRAKFVNYLTLSHIQMLSDASASENFWKHCDKSRIYSKQAISSFATLFSKPFSNYTYIYRAFQLFLPGFFQRRPLQIFCMWERVNWPTCRYILMQPNIENLAKGESIVFQYTPIGLWSHLHLNFLYVKN